MNKQSVKRIQYREEVIISLEKAEAKIVANKCNGLIQYNLYDKYLEYDIPQ
jgi:hypothetical protein